MKREGSMKDGQKARHNPEDSGLTPTETYRRPLGTSINMSFKLIRFANKII